MSHTKPDAAQPEWIPPMCCSAEVHPSRNHNGVHCWGDERGPIDPEDMAYLGKAEVDSSVQNAAKEFIAHQDRKEQVPQHKCTCVLPWIFPYIQCSKEKSDSVESGSEKEEFPFVESDSVRWWGCKRCHSPIRVKPELEANPATDFAWNRLCRKEVLGCGDTTL